MRGIKETVIDCVKRELGNAKDNLYRAELSFKGLSGEELDQPFGQSTESKREILMGYQKRHHELSRALSWAKKI